VNVDLIVARDGQEAIAFLRGESAVSSSRDVLACYERGVNCYVVKPFELDEFTALVQAINRFWLGVVELPPE
jgi:DNA-binding response OmpR family regulator